MQLGEKIKELREKRNFSRHELASMLNISEQVVAAWEDGYSQPNEIQIEKIASIFGVSIVFTDDSTMPHTKRSKHRGSNIIINNAYNIAAVAYLAMGLIWGLWHPGWIIFIAAWFVQSFCHKDIFRNIYSIALVAFFVIGFVGSNAWGWAWIVFPVAWLIKTLVRDVRRNRYKDEF